MTKRRFLTLALLMIACLLTGCVMVTAGLVVGDGAEASVDDADGQWVVVTYTLEQGSSVNAMDALLETEQAADAALPDAGVGSIDGNEVGDDEYQLYFVGPDRHRMWQVLEPVFARTPLQWSRVELFESLDEDPDQVILPR